MASTSPILDPMEMPGSLPIWRTRRAGTASGIVSLIFSLDEFSPLQSISRGQSGMFEREKREEAPLSRGVTVIISTILIKLTILCNWRG